MHGARPVCPKCGLQMGLALIEGIDEAGHDLRTFECAYCSTERIEAMRYKYRDKP